MRRTTTFAGTYSSSSVTSSPMHPGVPPQWVAGLQPLRLDHHRLAFQVFRQRVRGEVASSAGALGRVPGPTPESARPPARRRWRAGRVGPVPPGRRRPRPVGPPPPALSFSLFSPKSWRLSSASSSRASAQLRLQAFLELHHFPVRGLQTGGVGFEPGVRRPESRGLGFQPGFSPPPARGCGPATALTRWGLGGLHPHNTSRKSARSGRT